MAEESPVDLTNRDPNELNGAVKVAFEDVLGEPDGTQSIDCAWKNAYKCFTCGKNCCYKFVTAMCGICIGLYWGCEFAMLTFNHVWCWTPSLKVCSILSGVCRQFVSLCIQCYLAPLCEACGMLFSKIQITKA